MNGRGFASSCQGRVLRVYVKPPEATTYRSDFAYIPRPADDTRWPTISKASSRGIAFGDRSTMAGPSHSGLS